MTLVISGFTIISLLAYVGLLAFTLMRGERARAGRVWLLLTLISAMATTATFLLPADFALTDALGRGFLTTALLSVTVVIFGNLVMRDISTKQSRIWLGLGGLWVVGLLVSAFATAPVTVGQSEWLLNTFSEPNITSLVTLVGLGAMSLFLIGRAFYAYYIARLPEVANRALFWVLNAAVVLMGVVMTVSGTDILALAGLLIMLMGIAGATYAQVSFRVFNIRGELSAAVRTLFYLVVTTVVVYGAIIAAQTVAAEGSEPSTPLLLLLLAFGTSLVYVPLRHLIDWLINLLLVRSTTNPTEAARLYSQRVSSAVDIDQLVRIATGTLIEVLNVRRASLIMVDQLPNAGHLVELKVRESNDGRGTVGYLSKTNPVFMQLATKHMPLSQFDVEFNPDYANIPAKEKQFLHSLQLSAYAPILNEQTLIGVLACGPKASDAPFYDHDLELLATMANQTGVALRNARLVGDLRKLNEEMTTLNQGLEQAKEEMERLDSVKSDFVTVASHELRTPLAQIRGYTDIVDALNEQGMLDKDQMTGMVLNLRKATERMEELIAAMLDVSQIDVDAMDLRFTQTSLESVMRMAIEPLTDAIKQRKLTLSARGLRGLPTIQADMQRLVQAFRNIVLNAIKFTPDGGRIEITATLQEAEKPGDETQIMIAITDTGVGIDKENLQLIFNKFYRGYDPGLHSTGTYKFLGAGPGLGLTIAKGVFEGHGGKIWAESSGHNMDSYPGSTFYIVLPLTPPADARRVLPFEDQAAAAAAEEVSSTSAPTLIR